MGLRGSSACVKYLLFIFNLIFVITGVIILSVGAVIQGVYYKYEHFLDNRFFSAPALLIAVGTIVLIISFFGCCGAVKENHCMILTFSALLGVIFILELAAGIAGYVLEDAAVEVINKRMNDSMVHYRDSPEITIVWDSIQKEFSCCGTNNITDWGIIYKNGSLPDSCCASFLHTQYSCNVTMAEEHHIRSCHVAVQESVIANAVTLGGVGVGIAFIQLLGIILSCCLAKSIRKHYESV
ncbi:CD63 antigen-like [Schistocerca nitens]|uniref:CD63 antigen-like n=1 Tax=Schistocerca nitens TaxID=7011 RepID=UPI002119241D|nr:CD63 antigen-like [Schistocerca nitens]